jgi:hypothetical protein
MVGEDGCPPEIAGDQTHADSAIADMCTACAGSEKAAHFRVSASSPPDEPSVIRVIALV